MKRAILCQLWCFIMMFLFSYQCYAETISSAELIRNAKQYDGKIITYRGEVVGDIMIRGGYAWLSVNDGSNAIGIWIRKDLIKDIQYIGSYKAKGDIVEVSGIFNRSCPEHGGDLDIHATNITRIISGETSLRKTNSNKFHIAFLLFIIISLTYLLRKFTQYRKA